MILMIMSCTGRQIMNTAKNRQNTHDYVVQYKGRQIMNTAENRQDTHDYVV